MAQTHTGSSRATMPGTRRKSRPGNRALLGGGATKRGREEDGGEDPPESAALGLRLKLRWATSVKAKREQTACSNGRAEEEDELENWRRRVCDWSSSSHGQSVGSLCPAQTQPSPQRDKACLARGRRQRWVDAHGTITCDPRHVGLHKAQSTDSSGAEHGAIRRCSGHLVLLDLNSRFGNHVATDRFTWILLARGPTGMDLWIRHLSIDATTFASALDKGQGPGRSFALSV